MSTTSSVLRDQIIDAIRMPQVASAAGIPIATWASTTTPRVFDGRVGYLGGRNRGRLPFVEVWVNNQGFLHTNMDGGTVMSEVLIRAHATGRDQNTAMDLLDEIVMTCMASIRSNPTYSYTAHGDDQLREATPGPFGWKQEAVVTVEHTYDRTTYERL